MKRFLTVMLLCFLVTSSLQAEQILPVDPGKYLNQPSLIGYVPNEFVVILDDNVAVDHSRDRQSRVAALGLSDFDQLADRYSVTTLRPQFPGSDRVDRGGDPATRSLARHYKVRFDSGNLDEVMAAYAALPSVKRVEPIGIHALYATPNDTYYDDPPAEFPYDQWHYWDTYGIDADLGWDTQPGDNTVVVGVLDTGVKYDHGDLGGSNPPGPNDNSTNGNIWVNAGEVPGNGIDDDGNGYIDDVIGWDFVERTDWYSYACVDTDCGGADNDPFDGNGHGTHVAGTIAAITNNGYAVAGVAGGYGNGTFSGGGNGVKVVPCRIGYTLRYLGSDVGVVIMDYVAEAMYYMAELKVSGVNVAAINCSFGSSNTGGLGAAVDYLLAQDVMIIVAAGNSNSSSADYLGQRTDCLDVGAATQSGAAASFSNYGSWVDIAAPGEGILSTVCDPADPTVDYISVFDGTSMAAPHVVGVAALLESHNPSLTAADKWNLMVNNTKAYTGAKYVGTGIVDAKLALDAAGGSENPPVADFSGTPVSGEVPLTVTFTDLSSNSPTSWSWTFGDGGTSTSQNPSHQYQATGTYTVSLTATNAYGSDVETKIGYITVTEPSTGGELHAQSDLPVAGTVSGTYTATHTSNDDRQSIREVESGGRPQSRYSYLEHKWTFAVPSSTSLTFYMEGYRSSNSDGDNFTFSYSTDNTNFTNLFTVSSTTEQVYSASIPNSVSGTVYVRVVDTDRTSGNRSLDYVYVDHMYIAYSTEPTAPVANFSGSPTSGTYPLTVQFTDLSTGAPTSWNWDFGDGGTSTSQNPSHQYQAAGSYTVSLTVSNTYGSDIETKSNYITVSEPPVGGTMHVQNIVVGRTVAGVNCNGTATITVFDSNGQPVSGATVNATATGPVGGSFSGTTGTDGTVQLVTGKTKSCTGEWCFEVTAVSHASLTYEPSSNLVTKACESGWVYGEGAGMSVSLPHEFGLMQNYPNPFNPITEISFAIPSTSHTTLKVYNITGQLIETLVDGVISAGFHTVSWDAAEYSSGVYLYRLSTAERNETKKMILLK